MGDVGPYGRVADVELSAGIVVTPLALVGGVFYSARTHETRAVSDVRRQA
jgi:hypothetical protein